MRRDTVLILDAIGRLDGRLDRVHERLDRVHERIDTLIDAIADLRVDLSTHTHTTEGDDE